MRLDWRLCLSAKARRRVAAPRIAKCMRDFHAKTSIEVKSHCAHFTKQVSVFTSFACAAVSSHYLVPFPSHTSAPVMLRASIASENDVEAVAKATGERDRRRAATHNCLASCKVAARNAQLSQTGFGNAKQCDAPLLRCLFQSLSSTAQAFFILQMPRGEWLGV